VPPETRAPAGGTARPPAGALAGAALLALVLLAAAGVLVARRRRPVRAGPGLEQEDLVPAVPEGVRVFDMNPADPREITGSLFEPRSVRDARLRQAREPQSHGQEADAQAAGEPPARGPERTGDDD